MMDALDYLIKKGKITIEEVEEARKEMMNEQIINTTLDNLHTQFCELNHDIGECRWYVEEEVEKEPWDRHCHREWKRLFLTFLFAVNNNHQESLLESTKLPIKARSEESTKGPDYRFTPR
jgi:hypothetical protein